MNNIGNTIDDIRNFVDDYSYIDDFLGVKRIYGVDGSSVDGWPSSAPNPLPVGEGSSCVIDGDKADLKFMGSAPVYWWVLVRQKADSGKFYAYDINACSKASFVVPYMC